MRGVGSLTSLGRGVRSRAGSSAMILVVAVVAVASSAAGPTYYAASRVSILRDNFSSVPVLGRGYEAVQYGQVSITLQALQSELAGAAPGLGRLFDQPTEAIEATVIDPGTNSGTTLAWRSDVCAHLRIEGACPTANSQIMISRSFAFSTGLRTGEKLDLSGWSPMTIVGVYAAPSGSDDYWFGRSSTYFPYENPPLAFQHTSVSEDALFATEATMQTAPPATQGEVVVDDPLAVSRLHPGDVSALSAQIASFSTNEGLSGAQAVVTSNIPQTVSAIQSAWSALAIPVLLITLQLLGLAWLLLFLVVSEAVGARGPEVALAKLRGQGRVRTTVFGLSEPVAVIVASLPLGALAGWGATWLLGRALLRAGTPVGLPALSWGAAAAATAGGLASIVLASWRTLRRPVVEQWRRASTSVNDRTWVLDSILLTGAVAGLAELLATGKVSSAHRSALSLLVPGLLGVAVAVVASRVLPFACRAAIRWSRSTGLAVFLALRQVARRPGGSRTTIMLATSFALATFALSGWALDQANFRTVANSEVGASTVLSVITPTGADLGTLVAKADPTGRQAAAVEEYSSNGVVTIAVDPQRWSHVVDWRTAAGADTRETVEQAVAALDPPEPPPLVLNGDTVQVDLTVKNLSPPDSTLSLDVVANGATAPTPVPLGVLPPSGPVWLSGSLVGCPCILQDLAVLPPPAAFAGGAPVGSIDLRAMEVHDASGWRAVAPRFTSSGGWISADNQPTPDKVNPGPAGLAWTFDFQSGGDATLSLVDRPSPIPAIASSQVARKGPYTAIGLDGTNLAVDVKATLAAAPGAPADGVIVDRRFADLAAAGDLVLVQPQVWLGPGAASRVVSKLEAEGVKVTATATQSGYAQTLQRQGPGLARVLFLGEAGIASVLAAGGAILGLYLTSRRRRYELAALEATGVSHRSILAAIASEQLVVLLFGVIVGIGTGLVATVIALRDVPQFLTQPTAPALATFPPTGELIAILVAAVAAVLAATLAASVALARSVRLEQLREAPA